MAYQSFEELEVWKRSCRLAVAIYKVLEEWRDYGLKDQIQRSAVSVASNIAEGYERGGKDFVRFLRMARGSAAELRTQVYIAHRIGRIPHQDAVQIVHETKVIAKMITRLARSRTPDSDPPSDPWPLKPDP